MELDGQSGLRVLVVGESWIKHTVHLKGFDQFHTTEYEEGADVFLSALRDSGFDVTYLRTHEISARFPTTQAEISEFDVVVVSDVGANSFLLCDETFVRSERSVNRLALVADHVYHGGGLVMVGGYMSFTGIDGRARYGMSPLAVVLPVEMLDFDDRVEVPEGCCPTIEEPEHEMVAGIPGDWPFLLGYNRVAAKPDSTVIARIGDDPLLVAGRAGLGNTVAFASDLAPHWAPREFLQWPYYGKLWEQIMNWAGGQSPVPRASGHEIADAAQ